MYKNVVGVDGMMCGMCEAHIADAIRAAFPDAQKVAASQKKKQAVFLTEEPAPEDTVKKAIEDTGYHYLGFSSELYEKKHLFGHKS